MKSNKNILVLALLLSLALAACGGGTDTDSVIATSVAQTQQISALETAAAGGSANQGDDNADAAADAPADATELPTETPTITETATPDIPQLTLSQATNCREGPAVYYGFLTTVQAGVLVEVVGVHAQGNDYVVIKNPNGAGNCWLWLQYADKTDFNGYGLTAYNTPPTPTPTYTPTPSYDWEALWDIWIDGFGPFPSVFGRIGNTVTATISRPTFDVNITGNISANGQELSGTWTNTLGGNGVFSFQIKAGNINQFVGNYGGTFDWCGAKNSASQPSPCLWP
jgi:hypothetical protein